jgi:hypothetical protein
MYFLGRHEAKLLEKKLRRQIADQPRPKLVLCYSSGNRDYSSVAKAITASIGEFTEATVQFLFSVGGDGWNKELATNERWGRYREWRAAIGEMRRLYDAPGHQFEPHEAEHLSKVIEFALQLGWDALVAANPGRHLLWLSHDDRMEIYRGFEWRLLAEKLIALGFWRPKGTRRS